jgi:hypothetical protein
LGGAAGLRDPADCQLDAAAVVIAEMAGVVREGMGIAGLADRDGLERRADLEHLVERRRPVGTLYKGGPRHRDGRPARAEGQHKAGAAKQLPGGPRNS